jgi:autotransporter passenger strand-loop-strand repeat protein
VAAFRSKAGGREIVASDGVVSNSTVGSGGAIVISSGGIGTLVGGTINAGGLVETANGGDAGISGTVVNSGTLFASGSGSVLAITIGAVVNGGVAVVGNGIVFFEGASTENVRFQASGSGGLALGDQHVF